MENTLDTIDMTDMLRAGQTDGYWTRTNRWEYLEQACRMVRSIPDAQSALEIGPGTLPIVHGSTTMDVRQWGTRPPDILHDATVVPWPVADKSFDVAVALQVWEHLEGKQAEAFGELRRVARYAVLSLPHNWPGNDDHAGITLDTILAWSGGAKLLEHIVVGTEHPRIVVFFDLRFDRA